MRPGRAVLLWAFVGTVIATMVCLVNLEGTRDVLGGLVSADPSTPSGQMLQDDLPGEPIRAAGKHDGAFFYALARDPWHLAADAPFLDRPRYRAQRILFPAVAWALHPTGGGIGLLWTMFAVGVAGVFVGSWATGQLSLALRGPPAAALLFGVLPGATISLRLTVADALALALAVLAVWLSLRDHHGWALVAAVGAGLSKEAILITFVGWALWRRDRHGVAMVVAPAAVVAGWWLVLRQLLPDNLGMTEITPPLVGWYRSISFWQTLAEPIGLASAVFGVGVAVAALVVARPRHPLWWATLLNTVALAFYSEHVLAPERNAARVFMVLELFGLLMLMTRRYGSGAGRRTLPVDGVAAHPT